MKCTECETTMKLVFKSATLKQYDCPRCANFKDVDVKPKAKPGAKEAASIVKILYAEIGGCGVAMVAWADPSECLTVAAELQRNGVVIEMVEKTSKMGRRIDSWPHPFLGCVQEVA